MSDGVLTGWALVLAAARVAPAVLLAPAVAGLPLPRLAQAALALVLAAVVAGGLADAGAALAVAPPGARALLVAREVLIGALLGLAAAVPLAAARTAGGWIAAVDGDERGPWSTALALLGALVFFGVGGHLAVISALGLSYRALPVGGGWPAALGPTVVDAGAAMLAAALVLAAPLVVTALVVGLASAVVERAGGLAGPVLPELALRRTALVLGGAAALVAIAVALAGDVRALPDALARAVNRLAGG